MKNKNGYAVYAVRLGDEERNSKTLKLDVLLVFTEILKPLPKTIQQNDPHKILFEGTSFVPSPYVTTLQVPVCCMALLFVFYFLASVATFPCPALLNISWQPGMVA